jgi:ABC-type dipeptide/oligopeptide/nickel transport system permease subunit
MADKQYSKDYFTLVQDGENLADKPLKSRQLSYFQDAMLRFGKNKYNVIASLILLTIILMSIIVPIVTPKDRYDTTNGAYVTLPPRVPFLEKLGIFDGVSTQRNQPIDLETLTLRETGEKVNVEDIDFANFDPSLYTGYPTSNVNDLIVEEYIFKDTIDLDFIVGTESSPLYIGGTNTIYVQGGKDAYSIMSNGMFTFGVDPSIDLDIVDITKGTVVVYFADESLFTQVQVIDQATDERYTYDKVVAGEDFSSFTEVGRITSAGTHTIDLSGFVTEDQVGKIIVRFELDTPSEVSESVTFNSLTVTNADYDYKLGLNDAVSYTDSVVIEGYELSIFQLLSFNSDFENGSFSRMDAHIIRATFRYDNYQAVFAPQEKLFAESDYNKVLKDNPGMEDAIIEDSITENGWKFEEGWPITEVVQIDEVVIPGSGTFYNYTVNIDGKTALGVDKIPYFIFGTEAFGRDLFTLIFLGLRTSLLLGFASAVTNILIGIVWGAISGYYGGQVDLLMERFTDIWGSFPSITMIAIINALMDPGFMALYVFLVYNGWIGASRTTRMQFYRYKGREYVLAARTLGATDLRIIFKYILPNALGTIVTSVILSIPTVIFLEVNLSYLGFGIGNGATLKVFGLELTGTSIGVILSDSKSQIFAGNFWILIYPTIIVSLLMITFNMFGNALRDALNPQLRGSE